MGEPEELTEIERARQEAVRSAFADVRSALDSGDPEERNAAFGQLMQTVSGANSRETRDKLHVPDDAGQYRDALVAIMRRIPGGWGRWISCDAGWYPIITDLDRRLTAIDPGYELHQVKEKFGCLAYYFLASDQSYYDDMHALVHEAQERCASTCETCGRPGSLHANRRAWLKTLCVACATTGGYGPVGEMVDELTADMTGVWQVSVYGGADSVWDLVHGVVHIGGERLEADQVLVRVLPRVLGMFQLRLADGSEITSELISAIKRVR